MHINFNRVLYQFQFHKFPTQIKEILKTNSNLWPSKYVGQVYKEATTVNTLLVLFLEYLKLIKSFDYKKFFPEINFF